MKDYFSYNDGAGIVPEGHFRISPSQLSRFLDSTSQWYREMLLGENAAFQGNTMSHLGNCVHAAAEMYATKGEVYYDQIERYINSIKDPEVDKSFIYSQYESMIDTLIYSYLDSNIPLDSSTPSNSELFLYKEIIPGIGVGGSIDSIVGSTITDYKTTNALNAPNKISRNYWFQQMAYAWLCRMNNIQIDTIRLCFITTSQTGRVSEKTGKPLKDYPSTVSLVEHFITDQDIEIIDNTLKLVAHSVDTWNKHPELRHIIAQDWRLRPAPSLKLRK